MMKKITVEKTEGIAEVIDRVLAEPDDEVTVVIPKGSILGKSGRNFMLLKREAEAQGKSVMIESADPAIKAFAKAAGFTKTAHPFSEERSVGEVSDIVLVRRGAETEEEPSTPGRHHTGGEMKRRLVVAPEDTVQERSEEEEESNDDDRENAEADLGKTNSFFTGRQDRFFQNRTLQESEDENADEEGSGFPWKWVGVGLMIILILGVGAWGVAFAFGRMTIAINFIKTPWQQQGTFTADKSVSSINAANGTVPAQVFSINKNATQLFPASSEQNVSVKATGVLTIYNAYSSAPQSLVATTRFTTPDGKIFRLVSGIVVPGAKVTNSQIVPSSINAQVVADQPGPSYNVGPVAKLTVPGFANTPKFQGFYGTFASSTTGGFTGQKAVPTADDITAAKTKMTSLLQSDLKDSLTGTYPNNFVILDGASTIKVTKLTANTSTDQSGNFSVFGEATLSAIGFDQAAFKAFLLTLAQSTEPSSSFSSLTLQYSDVVPDFTKGTVTFALNAEGSLEPSFSSSTFDKAIAGKSIAAARVAIASLPQLQNGSISVWPSWLWSVPSDAKKIEINVN